MSTDTGTDTGTDTTNPGTLAERAARGAALLDEREPGWAARISLDELAMGSCHRCILGQLEGFYPDGMLAIGAPGLTIVPINESRLVRLSMRSEEWAAYHGFNLPYVSSNEGKYKDLADAWRAEIRKRTGEGAAS